MRIFGEWFCERTDNNSVDSSSPCSFQNCWDISGVALPAIVDSLEHVVCGKGPFGFVSIVLFEEGKVGKIEIDCEVLVEMPHR